MKKLSGALIALVNPATAIAAAFLVPDKALAWLVTMAVLACFAMLVGLAIDGMPLGVIVDDRNCYSLSKFQMLGWTVLVLSAWTVFVATRLQAGLGMAAANVTIEPELVALMAIATTSLIAAPMVLSLKVDQVPNADPATLTEGGVAKGNLYVRPQRSDARFIDIFRGNDVANYNIPDLSKIQQIIVTLVVMVVFGAAIWDLLASLHLPGATVQAATSQLPPLNENLVWLIGISHGGYLGYMAAPHSGRVSSVGAVG